MRSPLTRMPSRRAGVPRRLPLPALLAAAVMALVLTAAARLHSEDMARQNYFSHTSLDGRSPWDRIAAQGYPAASGENIAAGHKTPTAVMEGWMNSAGHRANILSCASRAIGVGVGYGGYYGTYWTQDFGRE